MEIPDITEIESQYCGSRGKPVLGNALVELRARWEAGHRDRETCLRPLFLAWYTCSEPTWLTGLPEQGGMMVVFQSVFAHLNDAFPDDPEFLFVAGYMAALWPWCCGEEAKWETTGRNCLKKFQATGEGLLPETFSGRGAYGFYFAHIVSSGWIEQHLGTTIRGEQSPPA